jgi:5-methylcytosine-specific restriction enzyme A
MKATVFDDTDGSGDAPYLRWLHDHPAGWVLNSRRRRDPTYMVLHKATCDSINRTARQAGDDPFTSRGYIKVCSEEPDSLLVWIRQSGGAGFGKRCSLCEA